MDEMVACLWPDSVQRWVLSEWVINPPIGSLRLAETMECEDTHDRAQIGWVECEIREEKGVEEPSPS